MTVEGKYIYSIIKRKDETKIFGSIGINNRAVKFLYYRDIAAIVSNTPIINFNRLDKKELTKFVTIHQKVNEEVMKFYDIVPMSFGIIAPNADKVLHILEKAYFQFEIALEKIAGKIEFVVQVYWERKKIVNELINTDSEIQKLRQELSFKRGILGMPIKLKLGKALQQKAEEHREIYVRNIQKFLGNLACDWTSNKLIEDEMIANFSFLIKRVHESELDRRMAELGKKYKKELNFKYIGPMPPYSFVNINLGLGNFKLIDGARKLLKLEEEVTFDKIKNAYYKFAYQYHPDKRLDDTETQEKMKKIIAAYDILKNYCHSCDEHKEKINNKKYSLKKIDVRKTLVIKEKQDWSNLR